MLFFKILVEAFFPLNLAFDFGLDWPSSTKVHGEDNHHIGLGNDIVPSHSILPANSNSKARCGDLPKIGIYCPGGGFLPWTDFVKARNTRHILL